MIKYRVWNTVDKAFCPFLNVEIVSGNINSLLPEEFITQQFTGIWDKHGKEIYDGDIIRGWTSNDGYEVIDRVVFKPNRGWYIRSSSAAYDEIVYGGGVALHESEIIGNYLENPDLIGRCDKPLGK
jgi:uncharacterized phage protein (TIGR01671 family)